MSPTVKRSSVLRVAVPAVLALSMVLVGCSSAMRQPTSYGDINSKGEGYYGNFMFGCTGVEPRDGKYVDETLSSSDYCRCLFKGLKDSVPFEDAKKFEEAQAKAEKGEMPEIPKGIEKVQDDCDELA